jgi:hypothetical protein
MKHPKLRLRNAEGLGDIVACILHSKFIGIITHFITGNDKPCQTCSQRAYALNVLFPIKVWRLRFKDRESFLISLKKEYDEYNLNNHIEIKKPAPEEPEPINIEKPKMETITGYNLISSSDESIGEHLVRVQIFKRK